LHRHRCPQPLGGCRGRGHVEAQTGVDSYLADLNACLAKIVQKINNNGGSKGSLSLVLMGNSAGGAPFRDALETAIYLHVGAGMRLNYLDLLDLRNCSREDRIRGAVTTLDDRYSACYYDPKAEKLWVDFGMNPAASVEKKPSDVEVFDVP
jgi:hypothetical protein